MSAGGRSPVRAAGGEEGNSGCGVASSTGNVDEDVEFSISASVPGLAGLCCHCKSENRRIFISDEPVFSGWGGGKEGL